MSQTRKTDYPCLVCKKHVKKGDENGAVKCCLCGLWLHALTCAGLSKEVFAFIKGENAHWGETSWKCVSCASFAKKIDMRMVAMEKEVENVKGTVSEHDKKISDLEREVKSLKDARAADKEAPAKMQRDTKTAVFSELREREQRGHNVVIRGLPEVAGAASEQAARDEDLAKVTELIAKLELQLEASAVVSTTRLNGSGDDDKPRQLLVNFRNSGDKNELLGSCKKLARLPEPWKSVYVAPDLTKWQRQEEKEMLKKAEELTSRLNDEESKN